LRHGRAGILAGEVALGQGHCGAGGGRCGGLRLPAPGAAAHARRGARPEHCIAEGAAEAGLQGGGALAGRCDQGRGGAGRVALHAAFEVSCQLTATARATLPLARQSWAAQLAAALQGIGMPVDLARPRPLCLGQLKRSALRRHLHETQAAAGRPGASKLAHCLAAAWGGQLPGAEEYVPLPAAYLGAVRQRLRRVAIAQLRTGSHWLAEETGRWEQVSRAQRTCLHCQSGLEDVQHALFVCPLYSPVRALFSDLVFEPTVHAF
jgi:hypothetical protein